MRLHQFVKGVDKNQQLFIGSTSAFVFCGTVDELLRDAATVDAYLKDCIKAAYKSSVAQLAIDTKSKRNIVWDTKENKRRTEIDFIVTRFIFDAENLLKRLTALKDAYANYKPILMREVSTSYDKLLGGEESGKVVIVEGDEQGAFWFKSEYDNWINNRVLPSDDSEEAEDGE